MNLFNVGAFFVLFREALEASIIMGVLLRYLDKTIGSANNKSLTEKEKDKNKKLLKKLKRQVWLGTIIGLGISIIIGVVFTIIFYVLKQDVLGDNMPLFEGILQSLAVLLLTWLAFKMVSVNDMYAKWERKIQAATANHHDNKKDDKNVGTGFEQKKKVTFNQSETENYSSSTSSISETNSIKTNTDSLDSSTLPPPSSPSDINDNDKLSQQNKNPEKFNKKESGYGFMLLTFSVIIREGLESVIFIAGIGGGDPVSLIIPGLLGIAAGIVCGYALYKGAGNLDLKLFFRISTAVLLVIAAGLACNASWELEEWHYLHIINFNVEGAGEGDEGAGAAEFTDETGGWIWVPERSPTLWNVCECCSEYNHGFFQIMGTLVGWKCAPSVVTTVVYFGYWMVVTLLFLFVKIRRPIQQNVSSSAA